MQLLVELGYCSQATHSQAPPNQKILNTGVLLDTTGDGVGNKSVNVYAIGNAGQMYWFAALVNGELIGVTQNMSANAYLKKNIVFNQGVLNDEGELSVTLEEAKSKFRKWNSIGKGESNAYEGIFDGRGHEVQGLFLSEYESRRGLFRCIKGG